MTQNQGLRPPEAMTTPARSLQGRLVPKSPAGAGRRPAATTDHLIVYVSAGSYASADAVAMVEPLEEALEYVEQRTGMRLLRPINVVFDRRSDGCGLDAVAYTHVRTVSLYTCPDTPAQRAINILSHEFVHQLAHDHYGEAHLEADLILSEGLATWGAGEYWLGEEANFNDFVAKHYAARLLPLATDPRAGVSTDTLNQIYYQWAAYVEWIDATYGRDALESLYGAGLGRQPGSAPYQQVLGISLSDAEKQWQTSLQK